MDRTGEMNTYATHSLYPGNRYYNTFRAYIEWTTDLTIKRYITNFLFRAFSREKQGPYPGPYLMDPRGPERSAWARGLARIWRRPSKPDVEGSNPSGSAVALLKKNEEATK